MSKKPLSFPLVLIVLLQILQFVNNSNGQQSVSIRLSEGVAEVEGKYLSRPLNPRNFSFLDNYAGATGLSERLLDLTLRDTEGRAVSYKRFMSGEYVADADVGSWKYKVRLTPPTNAPAAAHVSWMNNDIAILMMRDLLPQNFAGSTLAEIHVSRPDWNVNVFSPLPALRDQLSTNDDSGVVIAGQNLRYLGRRVGGTPLSTVVSGKWQFTDGDAFDASAEIFQYYNETIGPLSRAPVQITFARFPIDVPVDQWEADTRGNSIVVLSSDTPFRSQSIQRLHEQLRHEIFHLWFPNGVNLTGKYDWFYEGFALYQSLKLGVAVNRIRFDDYLDTLSRAYDIDRRWPQKMSLIEASRQRWNGGNTQVYARGMLAAFLCDLALLENSKGKTSVTGLLRELYQAHRPPAAAEDGNEAVLKFMRSRAELTPIIERNITGSESIEWDRLLQSAGLAADASRSDTKLVVVSKLSGRQKDLLDKLGYNNWRKLSKGSK